MRSELHCADSAKLLGGFHDCEFDSCVTDGPYELGFMGQDWDRKGIVNRPEFWREVHRVLKPGAHLLSFGATRTSHRMVCAIEDAGFEIRDSIDWIYGQGFPKNRKLGKGRGTALKPAHEPICVARKPFRGTLENSVFARGTGGLNIDACRVPFASAADRANSVDKNQHEDFGSGPTDNQIFGKFDKPRPNYRASGRHPANLIHDGSEEALGALGSAARFFYCAKPLRNEREAGLENFPAEITDDGRTTPIDNPFLRGKTLRKNTHPTVKPIALMRYLVRLVTPAGGTALDPFLGSGTTGIACALEDYGFVGIDETERYVRMSRARIDHWRAQREARKAAA